MASPRCWTAHLWKRKSSWAATILSTCPISMPHSRGPRVARAQVMASWRCVRFGPWHKLMDFREGDEQARSTADAVARRSYGKLVAFLVGVGESTGRESPSRRGQHHGPGATQIPMPSNESGPPTLTVRFVPIGWRPGLLRVQAGVPGGKEGMTTLI